MPLLLRYVLLFVACLFNRTLFLSICTYIPLTAFCKVRRLGRRFDGDVVAIALCMFLNISRGYLGNDIAEKLILIARPTGFRHGNMIETWCTTTLAFAVQGLSGTSHAMPARALSPLLPATEPGTHSSLPPSPLASRDGTCPCTSPGASMRDISLPRAGAPCSHLWQ